MSAAKSAIGGEAECSSVTNRRSRPTAAINKEFEARDTTSSNFGAYADAQIEAGLPDQLDKRSIPPEHRHSWAYATPHGNVLPIFGGLFR